MSTNNLLPSTSAGGFSSTGNIAANVFIGNGSQLTSVTGNLAFYDTTMYVPANVSSQFLNISYNGEGYSYFQLPSDATANTTNALLNNQIGNVTIGTGRNGIGTQSWMFGNDGILTVPGEGIIQSLNDTVILQSIDGTGNVYSARLGTNGGLYFATTEYPGGWLDITNNAGNASIASPINLGGAAGHNLNLTAGAADNGVFNTNPGGNLNLVGGLGGFNDDGIGGPGGDVNITAGAPGEAAGVAGNVNIAAGTAAWTFNNNSQLTVANLAISATNGIGASASILEDNGSLQVLATGTNGVVNIGWSDTTSLGNTAVMWFNEPGNVGNAVIRTGNTAADSFAWVFDNAGNLTIPNQAGGLIKTAVNGAIGIVAINGGTDNPAQLMSWRTTEANPDTIVSTYANSATIMSNVNGAMNTWTFDNAGNLTIPNAILAQGVSSPAPVISGFEFIGSLRGNVSTTGSVIGGKVYVGPSTSANITRFPNALAVVSSTTANIQVNELGPTGLIAEATGNPANTTYRGVGLYGVGYTSGAASADGVSGEAHVSDSTDTGTATAVRGYADSTHSGINIGLYSSALGGDTNYALYMKHGDILSFDSQAWTVVANTANALTIGSATSANLLVVNTAANVIDMSGNLSVAGNVYGNNLTTKATGSWTLSSGVNTVSITVPANGTYSMWVNGNIPNGICVWNATVTVTNTNVPVIGSQYAWYYAAGNALVLTSIPAQIIGTNGVIGNATGAGTTNNVFEFGITNNSGSSQVVNWGWVTLS